MKKINVRNAEGYELCHDITQILPGEFKGAKFLRGHIIRKEDIEVLISLGKENIFVMEEEDKEKNLIHENDAAMFIVEKLNLDKEFFEQAKNYICQILNDFYLKEKIFFGNYLY